MSPHSGDVPPGRQASLTGEGRAPDPSTSWKQAWVGREGRAGVCVCARGGCAAHKSLLVIQHLSPVLAAPAVAPRVRSGWMWSLCQGHQDRHPARPGPAGTRTQPRRAQRGRRSRQT
jgi:hypothetical protein